MLYTPFHIKTSKIGPYARCSENIHEIVLIKEEFTLLGIHYAPCRKPLFPHNASWAGDFMQSLFFFNIFSGSCSLCFALYGSFRFD